MFKKNEGSSSQKDFDTLVGSKSVFSGNIESDGTIRVDGKVKGDVKTDGDVYIGNDAVVTGNVFADNVYLSGTVEGNVNSKAMLKLLTSGRLYGDIYVVSFVADEGGIFQGKCNMMDTPEAVESAAESGPQKTRKNGTARDYKKSSVISQTSEDKEE